MHKKCYKCNKKKLYKFFYKNKSRPDGLNTECKLCCKRYINLLRNARIKRNLQKISNYKSKYGCCKCNENTPICLQFHHLNDDKYKNVSDLINQGAGIKKIYQEIDKCEILCANCHRKTHNKINNRKFQNIRNIINKIKSNLKCFYCNEDNFLCLDFHHINPEDKISEISTMICKNYNVQDILLEIKKCMVLCANCHFKYHNTCHS